MSRKDLTSALKLNRKNTKICGIIFLGAVAGCAMFFQRSSYISLYTLSKALEVKQKHIFKIIMLAYNMILNLFLLGSI